LIIPIKTQPRDYSLP